MPAYTQPMMSAGQMSHDSDLTNQPPVSGDVGTCSAPEYIGAVETDYSTPVEEYYSTETFVAVSGVVDIGADVIVDECQPEDIPADRQVSYIPANHYDFDIIFTLFNSNYAITLRSQLQYWAFFLFFSVYC